MSSYFSENELNAKFAENGTNKFQQSSCVIKGQEAEFLIGNTTTRSDVQIEKQENPIFKKNLYILKNIGDDKEDIDPNNCNGVIQSIALNEEEEGQESEISSNDELSKQNMNQLKKLKHFEALRRK